MGLLAVQLLASLRSHGTGEVEVVTVAFTDLEGFTSFTDTHGDKRGGGDDQRAESGGRPYRAPLARARGEAPR